MSSSFWRLDHLASHIHGSWLHTPRQPQTGITLRGVCIDSRTADAGQVFVALKGEHHDAHAYLTHVLDKGVGALILHDERAWNLARSHPRSAEVGVVLVRDTGIALLDLGGALRRSFVDTRVLAVGGSNGKTTTVRLLHACLAGAMRTRSSAKSFNNAVGVPLTILSTRADDQALICEVGTNAPGELAPLAQVVEPDIAVITSLGREHLEGLGDLRGVAREEASLLQGLREGGTAFVNADSPELLDAVHDEAHIAARAGRRISVRTFGFAPQSDTRVVEAMQSFDGVQFSLNDGTSWHVPLVGLHNAFNSAGAIDVARHMDVPDTTIASGLASVQGPPMRLERLTITTDGQPIRVINDCYNANPESMLAALRTFKDLANSRGAATRRVAVLGDMLELGPQANSLHAEVLEAAITTHAADQIVLIGSIWGRVMLGKQPSATAPNIKYFPDLQTNISAIAMCLQPGDALLLKGSRGMALERLLPALRERWSTSNPLPEIKTALPTSHHT